MRSPEWPCYIRFSTGRQYPLPLAYQIWLTFEPGRHELTLTGIAEGHPSRLAR